MGEFGEKRDSKQTIDFFLRFFKEDVLYLLGTMDNHTVSFSRRKNKQIVIQSLVTGEWTMCTVSFCCLQLQCNEHSQLKSRQTTVFQSASIAFISERYLKSWVFSRQILLNSNPKHIAINSLLRQIRSWCDANAIITMYLFLNFPRPFPAMNL